MSKTPTLYRGHLIVEDDPRVGQLIPHAVHRKEGAREFYIVPHQLDEYRVMRNLGYDIQPPILSDYEWPVVNGYLPFEAQKLTAAMITTNDRSFVLNDLGTGKTRGALMAFDYLKRCGRATRLLVAAPLSTLRRTWAQEILQTFSGMRYRVLYGTAEKRLRLLAEEADVYIVNHDGLEIILPEVLKRPDIDMVVWDELTAIKNAKSARWKVADKLFRKTPRVVGMTGLLTPQGPLDAYGQIKAITPAALQGISYSSWRDMTMRKITQFKYLPKIDANDTVFRYVKPAVRFTREQCVDLPPVQYVDFDCSLSDQQKKLFNQFKNEYAAQIANGTITVQHGADLANKMMQVLLGCVYQPDGSVAYLDAAPRLNVLDEIMAQAQGNKVIIYTPYKHSLKMLQDHLNQKTARCEVVSGDTPVGQRNEVFRRMQEDASLEILAAHPACMSHGLTLTAASIIVWWGVPPSVEIYEQANARITRPGQKKHQYIAHIVSTSFEAARYRQLQQRVDTSDLFLQMVKNQQLSEVL